MATFIGVPLKKTSEIDLVKPLKYVFSSFCVAADEPVNYDDALTELNKLRMNSTWRTLDKHENSLDVMTKYYDQLNFLDAKCPNVEFQVSFKWKDAFDKGSFFMGSASLTMPTLSYEKICILFNIGAMQSQVACSHISDTKNDEGLKLAAKYFQMASGTFQHLKTIAVSPALDEPTPDLKADSLSALQALMLAQAQESFFYKATAGSMKDGIIAKVACRAEELYADALKLMQKETVHSLWEKDWVPTVSGKQAAFHALSEYYQSLVCKAKKDVGEEIARLQKAIEIMKTAESKGVLTSDMKDYLPKITHSYDESKKDNDFIYHARVPDSKSLAPIEKAALAKPILPDQKLNPNSHDLFGALLPVAVQQAMSAFDLRKMEIVNGEKAKMQSDTQVLNGILASLNLPAALEDSSGNSLPQSLREKTEAVKAAGGMEHLLRLLRDLPSLVERNRDILKEIQRNMADEEQTDDELRAKFGMQWQRTPSSKLNDPLKGAHRKYEGLLNTANNADGVVREKCEKHREKISLLCLPEDQILSGIPECSSGGGQSAAKEQLKVLMRDVDRMKAEREDLMNELESATTDMKAKFLSALSAEGGVNEQSLSIETLGEIYGPIQNRIRSNLSRQEELVAKILSSNTEFNKEKNTDSSTNTREKLFSDLAVAHNAFMEISGNLEEGVKFYNNLTEVLVSFQTKINDFCFARKTEKEELVKDLQRHIVTASVQPSPLQPPAHHSAVKPTRPPPPQTSGSGPATAPPTDTWNNPYGNSMLPPEAAAVLTHQAPGPYTPYPPYPYPAMQTMYTPYGQQPVMQPFPPAPGYQPTGYPTYPPATNTYPYPTQQYRPPWPQ